MLDFRSVFANTANMALTPKQKNVLDFVASFTERTGYCPSFEEIARGVGLGSLATVHKHITALQQKGYLKRRYNESRSLEVSEEYLRSEHDRLEKRESGSPFEIPLMGTIAAGAPVEAMESPETLDFGDFAGAPGMFALRVRGDSMIEDHICAGDYVLVQKVQSARDGEIVVALVDGVETTLKRLYREGENIRLQPANASMAPIIVPAANVQLQGRVLAVLRKYR
jgi:repressor LexA